MAAARARVAPANRAAGLAKTRWGLEAGRVAYAAAAAAMRHGVEDPEAATTIGIATAYAWLYPRRNPAGAFAGTGFDYIPHNRKPGRPRVDDPESEEPAGRGRLRCGRCGKRGHYRDACPLGA